jgi:hypothetical protein
VIKEIEEKSVLGFGFLVDFFCKNFLT